MTTPMASPGLVSALQAPILRPELTPDYLDMQRQQMLAQALMGTAQQSAQTPQEWNAMRVVPRRSPLQNVATLASALMAGKAQNAALDSQKGYFQKLYGPDPGQQPSAAPDPTSMPTNSAVPPYLRADAPAGTSPSAPAPGLMPPQPSAGGPMGAITAALPNVNPQLLRILAASDPQKLLELSANAGMPTDTSKDLSSAGIRQGSPEFNAMIRNKIAPPMDVRPSGTVFDSVHNRALFTAPSADGAFTQWDANGMPSTAPVPGALPLAAQREGMVTGAKNINTPQNIPTKGGGTTFGYLPDVVGLPPALRGQPQSQLVGVSPPGQPPSTGSSPAQSAQPSGAASAPAGAKGDWWPSMPKLQISNTVGSPDEFTKGRLQAAGAKDAELSSKYGAEADLADQKQQYNSEALKLLPTAEAGPVSDWLTENRAKLHELGIPEALIPGSGKVTPTLELNKYLKNAALQGARQIYGSRMTQMEVRLQTDEMSPSSSMTRDAISSLIQQDNIKNTYAKQRADDYGKFIQQGGDPLKFESGYARQFPLTKFAQANSQQPSAQSPSAHSPAPSLAPITATGPNGKKLILQNGQWQPVQ